MKSAYNLLARKRWWEEKGEQLAKCLFDDLKGFVDDLRPTRDLMLTYFRTYSVQQANLLRGLGKITVDPSFAKIKVNVIKSVVDTAGAHIGSNKTRPFFLTNKGTQIDRDNALALNRAMLGLFYAGNHYEVAPLVFQAAAVFGIGTELVQATPTGKIIYERVLPFEQKWDPAEAILGPPRNRYIVKECSRYEVECWAKEYGAELEHPGGCELLEHIWTDLQDKDSCTLIFGWHLASRDGVPDGRFVVACSNQVFHDAVYDRMRPPLVDFHIQRPQVGWIGDGYASELLPFQVEVNYVAQKQQTLINLATTQLWVKKGEGIGKLDNRNMAQREYKNTPPVVLPVTPFTREFNEWREWVTNKAYQMVGITELSARGMKPPGIDSGAGLRMYKDYTSRRLQEVDQNWDNHHVKVAEVTLDVCRDIVKAGRAPKKVLAMGDRYVEQIPFEKLTQLNRDQFSIRPFPVSMLPETPEGKIQLAHDMAAFDPSYGDVALQAMSGMPDIDAAIDRKNAPRNLLMFHLGEMLANKTQHMPSSVMDLASAKVETLNAICQAEREELGPEVIDKLARYNSELDRLQILAQPPPPPPGPGGPGAGPGPGGMPPGMGGPPMLTPGVGPSAIPSPQMMINNPTGAMPRMG